ncbi:MAG: amidohydrolase family protein, partial [Myxococcales bacterium]|nr:amidohydrolase family protein [Myxococcales bacterium]
PGAWSTLRDDAPRAERLRAAGLRIAVGTDANPGTSPALDLGLMAALAVRDAGLTAEEAILGITSHAAAALGRTDVGRIATGCHGDLVVHANRDPRTLAYALGSVRPRHVLLGGQRVAGEDGPSPW